MAVIAPCFQELKALGHVDGKTVALDCRDAEGKYEGLPVLDSLGPDVIFSFGGEQAPIVKRATASIPIVVVVSNDPVASGLVGAWREGMRRAKYSARVVADLIFFGGGSYAIVTPTS